VQIVGGLDGVGVEGASDVVLGVEECDGSAGGDVGRAPLEVDYLKFDIAIFNGSGAWYDEGWLVKAVAGGEAVDETGDGLVAQLLWGFKAYAGDVTAFEGNGPLGVEKVV
jgi:hypothetical protein